MIDLVALHFKFCEPFLRAFAAIDEVSLILCLKHLGRRMPSKSGDSRIISKDS